MTPEWWGDGTRGTVSAGRRRAERVAGRRPGGRAILGALALLLATVAWFALVVVAIDLGRSARTDGGTKDWLLTRCRDRGGRVVPDAGVRAGGPGPRAFRSRVRHEPGRHR